jgi:hypothetical protein
MMQIYFGYELSETELRESCEFKDSDIDIGNQSQIDFIIVADICEELPYYLAIHLKGMYSQHNTSFRGIPKTIFIYWHD